MLGIKISDRVSVCNTQRFGSEPVNGTVEDIHEERDIHNILVYRVLLVRLDDGGLIKCRAEDVTLIQEPKSEEDPNTITISVEMFNIAVSKILDPSNYAEKFSTPDFALAFNMTALFVCDKLKEELFGEMGK